MEQRGDTLLHTPFGMRGDLPVVHFDEADHSYRPEAIAQTLARVAGEYHRW